MNQRPFHHSDHLVASSRACVLRECREAIRLLTGSLKVGIGGPEVVRELERRLAQLHEVSDIHAFSEATTGDLVAQPA